MRSFLISSALALAMVPVAHSANVYPANLVAEGAFNWSTGTDGFYLTGDDYRNQWGVVGSMSGGTAAITTDSARNGDGSLRLAANGGTSAKIGVAYYPGTQQGFGPLSSITAASFDWLRATGSAPGDAGPLMRLYLFTPGSDTHVATLVWTTTGNGITPADDNWDTANVMAGQVVQLKNPGPQYNIPMSFAAAQTHVDFKDLIVRAVEVGFGRGGWSPAFVGAVDQVILRGSSASVSANFEVAPPPPPTAVPTMGLEGLLGMSAALGAAAWFRRRTRTRRD